MALTTVLSVEVRPDRLRRYEELCQGLAERAREKKEELRWTTHQTLFGSVDQLHFVAGNADFAELSSRGIVPDMIRRVLGEKKGDELLQDAGECVARQRFEISVDRPELSYPPDLERRTASLAVVTVARARPGHQEACEELIRKIAEAIPKVGDPSQIHTFQTIVGDLAQYWTVRPLDDLAELDKILPTPELLTQAFGAAEGGLIYRTGLDAVERVERSIVTYREELSNPE